MKRFKGNATKKRPRTVKAERYPGDLPKMKDYVFTRKEKKSNIGKERVLPWKTFDQGTST